MQIKKLLEQHIRQGTLMLTLPDGSQHCMGRGEPIAVWHIHNNAALRRMLADPEFMVGQAYLDGDWDTGGEPLVPLLHVLLSNFPVRRSGLLYWLRLLSRPLMQWNRIAASRRNVSRHYDLDEGLFRAFLDEDMQYSCAYFRLPHMNLEAAQQAKCRHIARKLLLSPGMRVLDIGCGWGGLAIHLAREAGVRVTGLTLSQEQYRVARERVRQAGLQDQVEIRLEDYREHFESYDRIVSVGMFEHVGVPNYDTYFARILSMLEEDGVALVHTIGRSGTATTTNPWIRRYIFPGGYIPAMSEVMQAVERAGLVTADVEVLRLHYARTLAEWQKRFQQQRARFAQEKGERFCRMWEFYLAVCEAAFHWRGLAVFQFQLSRKVDAVPLTREYLYRPLSETPSTAGASPHIRAV